MAPPSASAIGGSPIGGPSPSPPLGLRAQFRRQGSSYGPSHVHHMAVMVAPKRVDYSVNKGGLKSWIVLIVFVLLCSAILTIFSEDGEDSESANEAMSDSQKDGEEEEIDGGTANIPSAGIAAGEDGEDDDDDGEDEEDEKEEEEEEDEGDEEEKGKDQQQRDAEEEEERMLARLKEAAAMARRRQKEDAKKTKAKREAEKRQRMEQEEDRERERKKREQENEEKEEEGEEEEERVEESEEEIEKDEEDNEVEDEEKGEEQPQFLGRDRHGKKEKRVPSWRGTQLQAAKEDTQKPRKNLLKQQKKRSFVQLRNKYGNEKTENNEEEADGQDEEAGEAEATTNVVENELIATRKRPIYNRKALTNRYDYKHRSLLDTADFLLEKHQFDAALRHYEQILATNKQSPRALFGRGRLHQLKAEFVSESEKNDPDQFIRMALSDYSSVLENEDTPDELFKMTVHHFVECAKIIGGHHHKILQAHRALIDRFPDDADLKCDFGVTWLSMARPEKAANIFQNVLEIDPQHALALAYLGYIQKVHEDELERGVHALRRAMRAGDERVASNARFYFHLGDGLVKLGRNREALEVYADAARHGLFPSVLQRSVHNLLGLSAHPWWTVEQIECAKQLRAMERQWTAIREEALQAWNKRRNLFVEEALPMASGMAGGEWTLTLRSNAIGGFKEGVCDRLMQSTCEILKQFEASSCAKDKIKLSVLLPGTRTWPFCGPTNYVLEAQLALEAQSDARIRVGNETRGWRPGRFLVFDTSFEREISFEGAPSSAIRLALMLELWHPQMPMELRGKIHADGTVGEKNKK